MRPSLMSASSSCAPPLVGQVRLGDFAGRRLCALREIVHRGDYAALLHRHAGERETHLDAGERAHQHEIVEVTEMADAEHLAAELGEAGAEAGLRSHIAGLPALDSLPAVPRALRRFMADTALYAYHAASAAIAEARLDSGLLASSRTALIVGSGVSSSLEIADNVALARSGGARKVLPYAVPRLMGSTTSANLATAFGVRGPSYSIVSACASSSHSIGHGAELIQLGKV